MTSNQHSIAAMRGYAERSKKLASGNKTEDELLQRVWNLAGDVTGLIEQLETAEAELTEWRTSIATETLQNGLREALDIIVWMSGATAFGPGGEAEQGWKATRDKLDPLFKLARGSNPASGPVGVAHWQDSRPNRLDQGSGCARCGEPEHQHPWLADYASVACLSFEEQSPATWSCEGCGSTTFAWRDHTVCSECAPRDASAPASEPEAS